MIFEPGQHYLSLTKTEKNMIDMVTKTLLMLCWFTMVPITLENGLRE